MFVNLNAEMYPSQLAVLLHREQRKRSMLLITTDAEFAESVSERVNIMFDGTVIYSGSVTSVVHSMFGEWKTLFAFLSSLNQSNLKKEDDAICN